MIKAVIFDCDGVLLKSNQAYVNVFKKLLNEYGMNVKNKTILERFGKHPREIIKEIMGAKYKPEIFEKYKQQVGSPEFLRTIKIMPSAKTLLKSLKPQYRLALVSGAIKLSLIPCIKKFGLQRYFDIILSGDSVAHPKPHPEMLLKAIRALRATPSETVYVGDAPSDIQMAKAAHVTIIVPTTGVLNKTRATHAGADFVIKNLSEIGRILNRLK